MGPNQHRRGAFPGTLGTCWEDDCLEQHPRACWMDLMLDTQVQGLVTGIQRVVPPPRHQAIALGCWGTSVQRALWAPCMALIC